MKKHELKERKVDSMNVNAIVDHPPSRRNSSVELIKVIAIGLIVLSHAMPDGDTTAYTGAINIGEATTNIQLFLAGLIHNFGQIGNAIFLACSAWFLLDSKKASGQKILQLMADCFVISVAWLAVFLLFGYELPFKTILKQFFPVTFGNAWFLTTYLLFYSLHPLLNVIIKNVKQVTLAMICSSFFMLYCCVGLIVGRGLLFNYSNIIGFAGIYFMVAYMRLYLKDISASMRWNLIALWVGIALWLASQLLTNYLGLHIDALSDDLMRWNVFYNPCFLLIAFSSLNLSRMFEWKNSCVNYISSLSLLIYLIHTNRLIRDYFRFDVFTFIQVRYTLDALLMWVFLFALASGIVAFLSAVLYKSLLQKIVYRFCALLSNKISRLWEVFYGYLLRLH